MLTLSSWLDPILTNNQKKNLIRIKDHAASIVSDDALAKASERWSDGTPETKEAYFIREIFDGLFPSETAAQTAVRWIPRGDWGCAADPSGRSVSIHNAAYETN